MAHILSVLSCQLARRPRLCSDNFVLASVTRQHTLDIYVVALQIYQYLKSSNSAVTLGGLLTFLELKRMSN